MNSHAPANVQTANPQRTHLRPFYLASFVGEATNLAMPFKVLLAVHALGVAGSAIVLATEQFASLLLGMPGGALADRWGRKWCVVAGHLIVVFGWLMAPAASFLPKCDRMPIMAAAFAMFGAGSALITGTQEAWAVDSLQAYGRDDLVSGYFGRDRFWASTGGLIASLIVMGLVARVDIRLFSVVTGLGEILAAVVLMRVPEERPAIRCLHAGEEAAAQPAGTVWRPELWSLALTLTWVAAALGMSTELFQLALASSQLSAHGFAALELVANGLCAVAPLVAVVLLEKYQPKNLLALAIVLVALLAASLAVGSRMGQLVAVYLLVRTCSRAMYTVADHCQHRLLTSSQRATASSAINFLGAAAQLGSAVLIAGLLHCYSARTVLALMGAAALPGALVLVIPFGTIRNLAWPMTRAAG